MKLLCTLQCANAVLPTYNYCIRFSQDTDCQRFLVGLFCKHLAIIQTIWAAIALSLYQLDHILVDKWSQHVLIVLVVTLI